MKSTDDSVVMEYNFLGRSGLKVSNICLGGATFGSHSSKAFGGIYSNPRQLDETLSHQVLDRFAEKGGNFIDTANVYSFGKSEEIVGKWLQRQTRQKFIVSSKVGEEFHPDDPNSTGLSRRHIVNSLEGSMDRLRTHYIDLYYTHVWDKGTPLEETLRTLNDLVRIGKIHYIGCSNVNSWQLQKIADLSTFMGLTKVIALQQQYNLLERHSEDDIFVVCQNEGIGIVPWSPLKFGMLTGKFNKKDNPTPTDGRVGQTKGLGILDFWNIYKENDKYWELVDVLKGLASKYGKTISQISLRWPLQKKMVSSIAIGVTSLEQLEENLVASKGWTLSDDDMEKLDQLSAVDKEYPNNFIEMVNHGRKNPYC